MEFLILIIIVVAVAVFWKVVFSKKVTLQQAAAKLHGPINQKMFCPHCNSTGTVHTRPISQKKGISGGKATAALLTGGLSILATGLSREESNTQAHCSNCNNTWCF